MEVDTVMTLSWNKWGAIFSCLGMRKLRLVALCFCSFSRSFCEYERFIHFFRDVGAGQLAGVF